MALRSHCGVGKTVEFEKRPAAAALGKLAYNVMCRSNARAQVLDSL